MGQEKDFARGTGYQRLWRWFGLSRASFLTMPRALLHEMPDAWQARFAVLLEEWGATFTKAPDVDLTVTARRAGRFVSLPEVFAYRHADRDAIAAMKAVEDRHGGDAARARDEAVAAVGAWLDEADPDDGTRRRELIRVAGSNPRIVETYLIAAYLKGAESRGVDE